jgi:C-terminal processing protease CtpA/Prc
MVKKQNMFRETINLNQIYSSMRLLVSSISRKYWTNASKNEKGQQYGIGIVHTCLSNDKSVIVGFSEKYTDAHQAGIKQYDVVLSIDGNDIPTVRTEKWSSSFIGEYGSIAEVKVQRGSEILIFMVPRYCKYNNHHYSQLYNDNGIPENITEIIRVIKTLKDN